MDFQIRMAHACDNHILLPQVREKKNYSYFTFQKMKAAKISLKKSPQEILIWWCLSNQPFLNNAKKPVGRILSTATCFIQWNLGWLEQDLQPQAQNHLTRGKANADPLLVTPASRSGGSRGQAPQCCSYFSLLVLFFKEDTQESVGDHIYINSADTC